jgi:hypothetical protein
MPVNARPQTLVASSDAYRNTETTIRQGSQTGASGNITIYPAGNQYFRILSPANNVTVTFAAPSQIYNSIVSTTGAYNISGLSGYTANVWWVEVSNRGSYTVTFNNVSWDGGSVPTLATTGKNLIMFYSPNGGSTIYGSIQYTM